MNTELHIVERIDKILNILQNIPRLQGFDQWNPVCESMKMLANLSQDIQKYEKTDKPEEECEDCKIHLVDEGEDHA